MIKYQDYSSVISSVYFKVKNRIVAENQIFDQLINKENQIFDLLINKEECLPGPKLNEVF